MIFTLSFKTPDVLHYATQNVSAEEKAEMHACADKFLEYEEYIRIEFDTDKQTATVLTV